MYYFKGQSVDKLLYKAQLAYERVSDRYFTYFDSTGLEFSTAPVLQDFTLSVDVHLVAGKRARVFGNKTSFTGRMVVLETGQIQFTSDQDSQRSTATGLYNSYFGKLVTLKIVKVGSVFELFINDISVFTASYATTDTFTFETINRHNGLYGEATYANILLLDGTGAEIINAPLDGAYSESNRNVSTGSAVTGLLTGNVDTEFYTYTAASKTYVGQSRNLEVL